jgi:hypothetical protein
MEPWLVIALVSAFGIGWSSRGLWVRRKYERYLKRAEQNLIHPPSRESDKLLPQIKIKGK